MARRQAKQSCGRKSGGLDFGVLKASLRRVGLWLFAGGAAGTPDADTAGRAGPRYELPGNTGRDCRGPTRRSAPATSKDAVR